MGKTKYAYLDKGGILHVVEGIKTAEEYRSKGSIIETDIESKYGFPVSGGVQVIAYTPDVMKTDTKGENIPIVPEIAKLYKKCMGN